MALNKSGKPFIRYVVVTNRKAANGEFEADWHHLRMSGTRVENDYFKTLQKGSLVYCEADYLPKSEAQEDGTYKNFTVLLLDKISVLSKPKSPSSESSIDAQTDGSSESLV